MSVIHPRSSVAVSLILSYLLVVLLCTPFTTAAHSLSTTKPGRSTQVQEPAPYRDGEILVRFRADISEKEKETLRVAHGARRKSQLKGDSGIEKLEVAPGRDAKNIALQLRLNPQVQFAEPNFLIGKEDLTPNDPQFAQQWALQNSGQNGGQYGSDIGASSAWNTTTGAPSTVIAVIDSGIDFTHPDLKNNQWTNPQPNSHGDLHGWDFVADSGEIKDEQGHGTAVAGIIAAEGNNGVGTTGVMWRAGLMSLRVLDNTGTGDVGNAVEAIDYASTHGAQVINLSWGTSGASIALKEAIDRALRRNVVVVCSAGNDSKDLDANPYFPASFGLSDLITVTATDNHDQRPDWSNWGARTVTVGAPGIDVLTTQRGGGYATVTGTSAAAPIVAGIAGLLKTARSGANTKQIAKAISDSARQITSLSGKVSSGGVVDAAGALAKLHGSPNQSSAVPHPVLGSGGTGPGGSFSTAPPAPLTSAPISNLPNLDEARHLKSESPQVKAPIESNLPCADCDPYGGGGGATNYPSGDPNFSTARGRPANETGQHGVDLGSRNFNWSLPLLSLPGRADLNVSLALSYNSLVWTKDGSFMKFNADLGTPAPGFRLGLPTLQQKFLSSQTGIYSYLMVTPSGARAELRQVGSSNIYESQDSTYMQLDASNPNALVLRTKEGTQFTFIPVSINSEYRCSQIKDRNGNYISATYDSTTGHLLTITDTLARVITLVYDTSGNLTSIRQTWAGVAHDWATFSYGQVYVAPGFGGGLAINGPNNNYTTVLTQVTLHDGTYFTFNYNASFAQVNRINHNAADGHLLEYTSYNVSSSTGQTECPRFTEQHDWAENWNNSNEAITYYSAAADGSSTQVTNPDGTIRKEFFYTSGWQAGLASSTETWSGGVRRKWTTTDWTQDNTGLTYVKNPRVTEINIYDEVGNRRRTVIETTPTYAQWGLPYCIHEYAANGSTEIRRTYYDYNLSQSYLDRRIIGLVSAIHLTDVGSYQGKVVYSYDEPGRLQAVPAAATQHDTTYNTSFTARGNVTSVSSWDVNDINNPAKMLATYFNYYTTGTPVSTTDPRGRVSSVTYADSFSDGVNRNTFAYPTTTTDADNFSATLKYNYDFGVLTRTQDPKGAVRTMTYDSASRLDRQTNETSGAYVRYVYSTAGWLATYATVNGAAEAYNITYFDGAGRVRAEGGDHPGSSSGFLGTLTFYDVMGRVNQVTNPAEINSAWVPTGDDAAGWGSTYQTFDWNGRSLVRTNTDGTTRENTYGGCGCAGADQITTRDENGRRKRYTNDVLGRLVKVEELNWDQTVYSTTNYTLNVRDQLSTINQEGQTRTFGYDGYGRLVTRTTPEQGTTTYTYFADDKTQTVTDARGATATFAYNNRQLVTGITYGVPSGVAATANVSFGYDSAGNRTSMTDGLGSVTYNYNTLSQLSSETRTFTGLAGTYTLSYGYSLGGQLNSITNPWGAQVGYGYDKVGRVTNVSGSGYAGLSSYVNSLSYRAFGLKQMAYNNGRTLSVSYDNRLRPTEWSIPGVLRLQYAYTFEPSGRLWFARNLDDETLDRYYGYDSLGRLTVSRSGNEARLAIGEQVPLLYNGPYSHGYQYDKWGNMTYREGWGGTNPSYTVSFTNNRMNGFTYDAAGNLTDATGGWTFTYDATGQQATSAMGNIQNGYDGTRLRGKKTENNVSTYYLRSTVLGGQVVAEIAQNGDWARGYVYLGGELVAVQQAGVYWMHQDPLVKSKRVTNSSGTVVSSIELDPWGGETNRSSNETFQPRKFASYERDSIGSDDAMHRRYNRWWTRFEQPDPYDGSYDLGNPQTFNRYAYVNNDPVNGVDPSGLVPPLCGVEFSGSYCTGMPGFWGGGFNFLDRHSALPPSETGGNTGREIIQGAEELHDERYWPEGQHLPSSAFSGGTSWAGFNPNNNGGGSTLSNGGDPNSERCKALAQKIANIQASITTHVSALIHNPGRLPEFSPTGKIKDGVTEHRDRVLAEAENLAKRIQEYKDNCGGGNPPTVAPARPPISFRNRSTNYPNGEYLVPIGIGVGIGVAVVACVIFAEVCIPVAAAGAAVVH